MPTLYVENVPEDLYEALRTRASQSRKSIAAEVIALLAENIPTEAELTRRRELLKRVTRIRLKRGAASGPFPTAEEMVREDRGR